MCVLSEEEGEEEEEETVDGEDLDEVHTESSAEEEEEEVEEEGAEKASQPPQQDPEPQSTAGETLGKPTPAPLPTTPAGQVSVPSAALPGQLCRVRPSRASNCSPVACRHHTPGEWLRESMHWRAKTFIALEHTHATVPCPLDLYVHRLIGKKLCC